MNKFNYSKIVKLELTMMAPLIIGGIIMGLLIKNSYVYPFIFVSFLVGSIFTIGVLRRLNYIEVSHE